MAGLMIDNNNAEVYAFTGGLLVLDIKDPGYAKVTRAMQEEGGKLYFIDNNHERQVLLTDYESRDELLVYSTIFMSDPTYYQTKRGPERFIDEYNKGLLGGLKASKNGSQPGEN